MSTLYLFFEKKEWIKQYLFRYWFQKLILVNTFKFITIGKNVVYCIWNTVSFNCGRRCNYEMLHCVRQKTYCLYLTLLQIPFYPKSFVWLKYLFNNKRLRLLLMLNGIMYKEHHIDLYRLFYIIFSWKKHLIQGNGSVPKIL